MCANANMQTKGCVPTHPRYNNNAHTATPVCPVSCGVPVYLYLYILRYTLYLLHSSTATSSIAVDQSNTGQATLEYTVCYSEVHPVHTYNTSVRLSVCGLSSYPLFLRSYTLYFGFSKTFPVHNCSR